VTVTASQIFTFLDQHPSCVVDRYEIHSSVFSVLRRNIRAIIARLYEGEEADAHEQADTLRVLLSEWLTVPISFDGILLESLSELGEPRIVEAKWGREVRTAYDLAYEAATEIQREENPARVQIRAIIEQLRTEKKHWRIYCHSRALVHFQAILSEEPISMNFFLHSVRDYREVEPFDVLLKMGPLRSRGWGSAPDALLSAPRFGNLMQVVWSGCFDEEDFGYDPTTTVQAKSAPTSNIQSFGRSVVSWKRNVITIGDKAGEGSESDLDELAFFTELSRGSEMRRAILLQLDAENGILYPPQSQVASFDPAYSADEAIGDRLAGETLVEGMFVIMPILGAADLGGLHTGEGQYSQIWKARLKEKRQSAPNDLLRRLHEGGIQLRNLSHSIQRWCRPATSVIHAPQTRRHFEILISVLGIDHDNTASSRSVKHPWWEYAWNEIARSRGEAIQTGMQEHEIVYEELFGILNEMLPELRSSAQNHEFFEVPIPANRPLHGVVRFYRIRSLEEGFLVPDTMLKVICDLDTVEQWRV
jgi:hypothetical protein